MLINAVASQAAGVFLWVVGLAVSSLLSGLSNRVKGWNYIEHSLQYAAKCEAFTDQPQTRLLQELDEVVSGGGSSMEAILEPTEPLLDAWVDP